MLRRLLEGWPLMLVLLFIVCDSAGKKPCRNYVYGSELVVRFNPSHCWDVGEAQWKCNDVLFDPRQIKADARK